MKKVMLLLTLFSSFGFCATQITDLKVTPISPVGKWSAKFPCASVILIQMAATPHFVPTISNSLASVEMLRSAFELAITTYSDFRKDSICIKEL